MQPLDNPSVTIAGVLLDVDGTLLDSNVAHARAWKDALAEEGIVLDVETLRRMIGMGADHMLPELGLSDEEGPGKRAKARKGPLFREKYLPSLRPQPGARALVERMRQAKIKRVVATSAGHDELALLLRKAEIDDLIEAEATSSQVSKSKPSPDIVDAAVARSGIAKEKLVMLGDTPYDVTASTRAGVKVVCLRCGGWGDSDLAGAVEIYDDPAQLCANFDASLFGPRA